MVEKPTDQNATPKNTKKPDAVRPSVDAVVAQKQTSVQEGAGQKLHQASLLSGLTDFSNHAAEQLGRMRNDAVLAVTGFRPADMVKNLPSDVIRSLARGRAIDEARAANPSMTLSPAQAEQLSKYQQYHDKIVNDGLNQTGLSSVMIDHKAMIAELNDAIAARYKTDYPSEARAQSRTLSVDQGLVASQDTHGTKQTKANIGAEPTRATQLETVIPTNLKNSGNDQPTPLPRNTATLKQDDIRVTDHVNLNLNTNLNIKATAGMSAGTSKSTSSDPSAARHARESSFDSSTGKQQNSSMSEATFKQKPESDPVRSRSYESRNTDNFGSRTANSFSKKSEGGESSPGEPNPGRSAGVDRTHNSASVTETVHSNHQFVPGAASPGQRASGESIVPIYGDLNANLKGVIKPASGNVDALSSPDAKISFRVDNPGLNSRASEPSRGRGSTGLDSTNQAKTTNEGHAVMQVRQPVQGVQSVAPIKSSERPGGGQIQVRSEQVSMGSRLQLDSHLLSNQFIRRIESIKEFIAAGKHNSPDMVRLLLVGSVNNNSAERVYLAIRSNLIGAPPTSSKQPIERQNFNRPSANAFVPKIAASNARREQPIPTPHAIGGAGAENNAHKVIHATTFRAFGEPKRHVLGAEIALTVILASAGIQRIRAEQTKRSGAVTTERTDEPVKGSHLSTVTTKTAGQHVQDRLSGMKIATKVDHPAHDLLTLKHKDESIRPTTFTIPGSKPLQIQQTLSGLNREQKLEVKLANSETKRAGENRYTFGTEVALAALLASGGIARHKARRTDNSSPVSNILEGPTDSAARSSDGHQSIPAREDRDHLLVSARHSSSSNKRESESPIVADLLSKLKVNLSQTEPLRFQLDALARRLFAAPVPIFVGGGIDSAYSSRWIQLEDEETRKRKPQEDETTKFKLQRPTVLVAKEDTLISIAETFFHDPNVAWLIAALNRGQTNQIELDGKLVVSLMTRQKLILPLFKPDIADFYAQIIEERPTEELITIVEETQIDRELLSSVLGGVVGQTRNEERQKKTQFDTNISKKNADRHLVFDD